MCGIFAMTGRLREGQMKEVLESMVHRGPDEGDETLLDNFHLGHQRLSIVGLNQGKQPIPNEDQSKWIVVNGEIYNYEKIKREQLTSSRFITESDSEVPLKLYEQEGPSSVKYLDGMFAFVIADSERNTFIAARDTIGIKPLYYGTTGDGKMVFASELKTLYIVTSDVNEFPPGHYYTPEEGFVSYREITEPESHQIFPKSDLEDMMEGIRHHLGNAVEKRLMADVEVGVLLSGGLDSSLIALLAQERRKMNLPPLKSFCVGSKNSEDVLRAREVAEEIGSDHYEYIYTEKELIEHLPEVIYHLESFDASLVRSAIPSYFVSKLAAEHVKVILSGEGADELFSGYQYLKGIKDTQKLNKELIRIVNTLHNINLQRADRMSMAHSLELRVPFLDLEMITHALKVPAELKMADDKIEKWVLRKAYDGSLADNIIWRNKAEFSEGSGALDILEAYADSQFSAQELKNAQEEDAVVRSKQELLYYQIFKRFFPQRSILSTVGRWSTD